MNKEITYLIRRVNLFLDEYCEISEEDRYDVETFKYPPEEQEKQEHKIEFSVFHSRFFIDVMKNKSVRIFLNLELTPLEVSGILSLFDKQFIELDIVIDIHEFTFDDDGRAVFGSDSMISYFDRLYPKTPEEINVNNPQKDLTETISMVSEPINKFDIGWYSSDDSNNFDVKTNPMKTGYSMVEDNPNPPPRTTQENITSYEYFFLRFK